ncbi:lipase 3-like isoform X2 [Haematobia irritans]|uniref:lipase 3-like isoform X2 n=1 Tax=Haematobia irritans TaxID=7368 RepID=UPI003F501E83
MKSDMFKDWRLMSLWRNETMKVFIVLYLILLRNLNINEYHITLNTCGRIIQHNYPCEKHVVQTSDGYLITVFRIPHTLWTYNVRGRKRPAVLLTHGLMSSSDIWVLNKPENGLPFMLANAGYDVWLANARGNIYSQNHVSLDPTSGQFWDFSLDEIGQYDLPAIIDYIIATTKQPSIHYVGYSQGTTLFFIMLSTKPSYGSKIKTSHLLGPAVFACHMTSPLLIPVAKILGRPFAANYFANISTHKYDEVIRSKVPSMCKYPIVDTMCASSIKLLAGWGTPYLNYDILEDFFKTAPAAISVRQLMQYYQFVFSCDFRPYSFDVTRNIQKYGMAQPPSYNLQNVHVKEPIDVYYSDNDYFVSLQDVEQLYRLLGERVSWHRVKYPKFNHFDFVLSKNVKEVISDCIVEQMEKYEGRSVNGSFCNHFKETHF